MTTAGRFLNVDLEIGARTRARLAPLIGQFKESLVELHAGRIRGLYRASYEHTESSIRRRGRTASAVIHALADVIEGLDRAGRRAWNAASIRDFDVGIEIPRGVWVVNQEIEADAIRRVAALRGRIVFTAYQLAALSRRRRSAGK